MSRSGEEKTKDFSPFGVGWNSWLTLGARPDGVMGIPRMGAPRGVPDDCVFVPFSRCRRFAGTDEANQMAVCFYEDDEVFADVIAHPDRYVDLLSRFRAVVSPDCSQYRNAPLAMQVGNLYVSRLVGAYWQRQGLEVIPQIRWGSEETFTDGYFREQIAFLGVEPDSTVAVSTYGCFTTKEDRDVFAAGFDAMIDTIEPERVFVYGSADGWAFGDLWASRTRIIHQPDWTARMHGRG